LSVWKFFTDESYHAYLPLHFRFILTTSFQKAAKEYSLPIMPVDEKHFIVKLIVMLKRIQTKNLPQATNTLFGAP
jgi:hypothetical protein